MTSSTTQIPQRAQAVVAIAGNPNTGKTTLFNRLTGAQLKVGNYPGVTVERFTGALELPSGRAITLVDVPGSYSLSARSREEEIAIHTIAGLGADEPPDVVVIVVDATQLARNLYLVLQVLELGVPVVVALNMVDLLASRGLVLDEAALASELGVPVVKLSALHDGGFAPLTDAIERVLDAPAVARPGPRWEPQSPALRADIEAVAEAQPTDSPRTAEREPVRRTAPLEPPPAADLSALRTAPPAPAPGAAPSAAATISPSETPVQPGAPRPEAAAAPTGQASGEATPAPSAARRDASANPTASTPSSCARWRSGTCRASRWRS